MTALFIVLSILFLLFLLLVLPITVKLNYNDGLICIIKYAGIVIFNSEKKVKLKKRKKRKKTHDNTAKNPQTKSKENYFKQIYKQKGFSGTVKYFFEIGIIVIKELWWVLKKFKFRNFRLRIVTATDDAANTAIEYGAICCAVYPVLSFLENKANFKNKSIDVYADFDKTEPEFAASIDVTVRFIYFLIAAISLLIEYIKIKRKESEKNE